MKLTEFEIFKRCFPEFKLAEPLFDELSERESCHIFREEGGAAFVNKNKLAFLAVLPEYRGKGIGTKLLSECEKYIAENGSEYIYCGGIFPGALKESTDFFLKNGYETKGEFVEMEMDIHGFSADIKRVPENFRFDFYSGNHDELLKAVGDVDEEWGQYFTDDSKVFCGFKNGCLASFCIVDDDIRCLLSNGENKVGSIGCVGTHPEFRKQGIGLYMVELATEILAQRGCDKGFIHCTHLEKWYSKLGYKTFLRYGAARKKL